VIKPVELLLQPSRILLSGVLSVHFVVLVLVLGFSLPLSLKTGLVLFTVVGAVWFVSRWRSPTYWQLSFRNSDWRLNDAAETAELVHWQRLGGLLVMRFKGKPALLILPDMLDGKTYRQLQQLLRFEFNC